MWSGLPAYIGGKRKLARVIFREIDRLVPRRHWRSLVFLDAFMGGASISLFAKAMGFKNVIGTDVALRSVAIGEALVANSRVKLTKADIVRVLSPRHGGPGPLESEMAPAVFTHSQARVIDNALALAHESGDVAKASLLRLLAIRIALLAHPFSYVRRGTIGRLTTGEFENITPSALPQYIAGLRLVTVGKLGQLAEEINQGIFEGSGEVHQVDIMEALPRFRADIAYFDPPYAGTLGYERTYRILDRILGDDRRDRSRFSCRDGAAELDRLLERATHIPIWVLSFGHETVSLEELEGKMGRMGRRTRSIAVKYSRLAALAKDEKRSADREYLVIGLDPDSRLLKGVAA